MKIEQIKHSLKESLENNRPFPEHVMKLIPAGVIKYTVDLEEKTVSYSGSKKGDEYHCNLPLKTKLFIAKHWEPLEIKNALILIQHGQSTYEQFLESITKAGVKSYIVDIFGHQVSYLGDHQEAFIEPFPQTLCEMVDEAYKKNSA